MLRVPSWAGGALLDGRPAEVSGGWVTARRRWRPGDEVTLTLPMPVRCHGSHPYLDATRGALAVARGPLIYCAEQQDCAASIDDLVLDAGNVASGQVCPAPQELPDALTIEVTARVSPPASRELYPELPLRRPGEARRSPGGAPAPPDSPGTVFSQETPPDSQGPVSPMARPPRKDGGAGVPARAVLIPYFLWGNRDPGPMRVWIRRG
jgi:DUF1680 family protein